MSRVPNRKSKVMVLFRTPLQVLNTSDVEEDCDSGGGDDGGGIGQALQSRQGRRRGHIRVLSDSEKDEKEENEGDAWKRG